MTFEVGDRIRLVADKAYWSDGTESTAAAVAGATGVIEEIQPIDLDAYGFWVKWDKAPGIASGWVDPALVIHEFSKGDRVVLVDAQFSPDGKTLTSHMGYHSGYHQKYLGTLGTIAGFNNEVESQADKARPQYLLKLDNDQEEYGHEGNGYYYDAVSFEPLRETVETASTLDDLDVPTEGVNEIIERIPTVQEIFTSFTGVNPEEGTKVSVGNPEVVTGFTLKRNDNGGVDLYLNGKLFPYAIAPDGLRITWSAQGYDIHLQVPVVLR